MSEIKIRAKSTLRYGSLTMEAPAGSSLRKFISFTPPYIELQAENEQLKQQLSDLQVTLDEQVAYGEKIKKHVPREALQWDKFPANPSPELLNTIKADAVKGYAYNLPFKGDLLTRKEAERHLGKYLASGGEL